AFFGFSHNAMINKTASQLASLFYLFSAILGVSMATLFVAYAGAEIARVFFITASMFLATSIFGYVTKRNLSNFGSLMMMGAIGILIAMIVNLFLQSSMMQFVISAIGVIVYTGLTAWDTQQIKETYSESAGSEANRKMAIFGALSLYMNFIMLLQFMMSLLSNRN
ncbi:MAG: Bax inhibitor-1/YccA family protein, partial [Alphaproteobacteria bacterium]|nr:Bax inhibitor-1/YccA family protein [Alphaproteobacteria bacterium]